jgi:nucleoside-diphosphate-sugar epimerase
MRKPLYVQAIQMNQRVFLAGASGAIGRRLIPLLVQAGYKVIGMSRSESKADLIRDLGAEPVIGNALDYASILAAVWVAKPRTVIHQLTDLPAGLDPSLMGEAIRRNAQLRDVGTRNLVRAAFVAGAEHMVAQSIAWAYAPGNEPHGEGDPLDLHAGGDRSVSVLGVAALERSTLSGALRGCVLRYGRFYGPGTGSDAPLPGFPSVHVDAAAHAALLAAMQGAAGIFNIAEPSPLVSSDRAQNALGWDFGFRAQYAESAA